MSSQTTFMGLPPELRLRIYDYALDPFACQDFTTKTRHHGIKSRCCLFPSRENKARCDCAASDISLAILQVNKQVHAEAIPVLCVNSELRVRMPFTSVNIAEVDSHELEDVLDSMSKHAQGHLRQLLLVGCNPLRIRHDWRCTTIIESLAEYWDIMASQLPNFRHLRMHLDVNERELKGLRYKMHAFGGLNKLAKLRKATFEFHQHDGHLISSIDSGWPDTLVEKMEDLYISELRQMIDGTQVEVDVQMVHEPAPWDDCPAPTTSAFRKARSARLR